MVMMMVMMMMLQLHDYTDLIQNNVFFTIPDGFDSELKLNNKLK